MRERTLSIHTASIRRREALTWAAILVTVELGRAVGNLITEGFGFGYLLGVVLFAGLIAVIVVLGQVFHVNAVFRFRAAYLLT